MSNYLRVKVVFYLDGEQQERIKTLLPKWQNYTTQDGQQPFKDMTIEGLASVLIGQDGWHMINERIEREETRQA